MKDIFKPGDIKVYHKKVTEADFARFESGTVHEVCSTFALGQAAEWACRLFVLDMKEDDEEGIGTMLHINHKSPALPLEIIEITAIFSEQNRNEVICKFEAKVGDRLVADGETGQKILKKEKLAKLLENIRA